MADAYVIIGFKRERCRAKNPAKCRYHVGSDGKPLKHYKDAWSADKALKRKLEQASKTSEPTNQDDETIIADDDLFVIDDGVPSTFNPSKNAINSKNKINLTDLSTPASALNKMRAQACMDTASADVASQILIEAKRALEEKGEWSTRLMWKETADSPREWPEWWSTSENARAALVDGRTDKTMEIIRSDQPVAKTMWSVDSLSADGKFSSSMQTWTAGLYDAVRDGRLKWDDLKEIGARTVWMESSMITSRHDDGAILKTVLAWCGRKPVMDDGDDDTSPIIGEDSWISPRASRSLEAMMRQVSEISVTMDQAIVEFHVLA